MSLGKQLTLTFIEGGLSTERDVIITKAVIGGWTGRDKAALQHHIDELGKIGVAPPEKTPMFYRVSASRLVTADAIEVIGDGSSGEVEYVMLKSEGKLWIGAGSDHTDRVFEHLGITLAKQLCDKPIASTFWLFDDVADHWDDLQIIARIRENDALVTYQEGSISAMLSPQELLSEYDDCPGDLEEGTLMFGGTIGAIGEVRFSGRFELELSDPVTGQKISHAYDVLPIPIRG